MNESKESLLNQTVLLEDAGGSLKTLAGALAQSMFDSQFEKSGETQVDLPRELAAMRISVESHPAKVDGHDVVVLRDCSEDYSVVRLIGRGGQGEVYEAHQHQLGRTVAVKQAGTRPDVQRDFFKEAFTSAQLDHPNIVPVYELGLLQKDGKARPILAMKRVQGSSWSALLKLDTDLHKKDPAGFLARHLAILIPVLNAVAYAHSKQIIHRDLKPAQVMVGNFGEVFLLDWGLAVFLGGELQHHPGEHELAPADTERLFTRETATNPAGTPAYMAPEQSLTDPKKLGFHTDIYLVGSILYEILTGLPPHAERNIAAAIQSVKKNIWKPLPDDVPTELRLLAERCLETDPKDRPPTIQAVRDAIEAYLSGSGRRQESQRLVEAVGARQRHLDYEALSASNRMLAQAAHLWPDNPDIAAERDRLLVQFVDVATGSGHFLLASLQASRLGNPALSERLQSRVQEAREAAAREIPRPRLLTPARFILLLCALLMIAASVVSIWGFARQAVLAEVHDKVRSLATLAAESLDAEALRGVDRRPTISSTEFQSTLNVLNSYRRSNNDIRFIYAYRPVESEGGRTWRVLVDADPLDIDHDGDGVISDMEKGNPPGSLYQDGTPAMLKAFQEKAPTSSILVDQWGTFVSGFAPVIDSETGDAAAIVGVDVELLRVEPRLNLVNGAAVLGGVLFGILVTMALLAWFSSRRALEQIALLEKRLHQQNAELRGRDLYLG